MAELKTKQNDSSVSDFLDAISDEKRRKDCWVIHGLMEQVVGEPGKMWGSSIVGYGSRPLTYESGRELDWMAVGFSPRKQDITLYLRGGAIGWEELLKKLGKHKTGKGCLYIKKLEDVDLATLQQLIKASVQNKR